MRFALFLITTIAIAGQFTTSLGDTYPYAISAITTDSAGNTYVVGSRQLGGVPTTISLIGDFSSLATIEAILTSPSASDVFVSKLDPNGKLLFTDTFAGKGIDTGTAIAVDPTGNIYIAGTTTSPDFPLTKALQTQPNTTYGTGFIIKLTNDGSTILYSTYFGGTLGGTSITALATDSKGNLYLTGTTTAADFPHTGGVPFSPIAGASSGAILASISAAGDKILYSGAIVGGPIPSNNGEKSTAGAGVAVDASGNAYFTGNIGGSNLSTTPGVLAPTGSFTGFLAKVTATGLSYLTYLPEFTSALAVDAVGNAYVAGYVTQGINGPFVASVTKINPSASAIVWTNNLGSADTIQSIAVDANGNAWATGTTEVPTFPNANGWTTGPEFLVGLNATGTQITYSALFPFGTVAQSVAIDPSGLVHVAGLNGFVSAIAPSTPPAMKISYFQNAAGGNVTARISAAEVISIYGPGIGPATAASATPTSAFYPTTFDGVQVAINGMNMPLLYVSANQINAVVPMEIAPNAAAAVHVTNGTAVTADYPVWIVASAPLAFPTVLNRDGTINSQTNPAHSGSIITFFATGWQSSLSPLADGQVATTAQNVCQALAPVAPPPPPAAVASGGKATTTCQVNPTPGVYAPSATVLYGGPVPGTVAGVTQFNVQIGTVAASNFAFQFSFSLTGEASVAETVWIAQ